MESSRAAKEFPAATEIRRHGHNAHGEGGAPLRALCEVLSLHDVFDQVMPRDRPHCHLSTGPCIQALGLNLLPARQPVHRVQEEFVLTDMAFVIGAGITAADLTEDALGRALHQRAAAFSTLAAQALFHDPG